METFWIQGRTDMGEANDSMVCKLPSRPPKNRSNNSSRSASSVTIKVDDNSTKRTGIKEEAKSDLLNIEKDEKGAEDEHNKETPISVKDDKIMVSTDNVTEHHNKVTSSVMADISLSNKKIPIIVEELIQDHLIDNKPSTQSGKQDNELDKSDSDKVSDNNEIYSDEMKMTGGFDAKMTITLVDV